MSFHNSLIGSTDEQQTEWYDLVAQFREKAAAFVRVYNELLSRANEVKKYPSLNKEYNRLVSSGQSIRNKITSVTNTIDRITGWLDSTFGGLDQEPDGLGAIWIPLAVVVGGVAAISKWFFDYQTFSNKLAEIKRLEEKGVTPAKAADIVNSINPPPPSVVSGILKPIVPVLFLGLLLVFNRMKK